VVAISVVHVAVIPLYCFMYLVLNLITNNSVLTTVLRHWSVVHWRMWIVDNYK